MSQAFRDHIWGQLCLGYTVKQIYDKHKAIWWTRINAREMMTLNDFIRQQNIAYLDHKHKKGSSHLHKNPTISICTWVLHHSNDVFYFQNVRKVNWIHIPFIVSIRTPSQVWYMLSLNNNGVISMDATFGTNNVKFHLFTLMAFDAHWYDVPIAWIITSCQTCNNLVEWLTPLKKKLQNNMSRWKPSCFTVHDVPQELWALQWVYFSIYISLVCYLLASISCYFISRFPCFGNGMH
jgi:hypothetical protein